MVDEQHMKIGGLGTQAAIGHPDLGEPPLTEEELDERLRAWPWQQLILKLGGIEHLRSFLGQDDWNVDGLLVREFLRPELRDAADACLSKGGIIANQASTGFLVLQTLRLGTNTDDRTDDQSDFADVLLAANDLLYPNDAPDNSTEDEVKDQLARLLV